MIIKLALEKMFKFFKKKSGIILFIALMTLLIVVLLANVVLSLMSSQSRITQHQIGRIQAFYAAQAGMVYALEMLRKGTASGGWNQASCGPPANPPGCVRPDASFSASIRDPVAPNTARQVRIVFCPTGSICAPSTTRCTTPAGITFCINVTADYTGR